MSTCRRGPLVVVSKPGLDSSRDAILLTGEALDGYVRAADFDGLSGRMQSAAEGGHVFIGKRTKEMMSEVVPLLRELFPERTDEQRAAVLNLFGAAHQRAPGKLEERHVETLIATLRYWAAARGPVIPDVDSPRWPGIEDTCGGCRDFKATLLEMLAGITVKTDQGGHVLLPIHVESMDARGQLLSEEFRRWIIGGGPFKANPSE